MRSVSAIALHRFGARAVYSTASAAPAASYEDWIQKINRFWKGGPGNTLALARLLGRARRSMERGEWSRLWRSQRVPFSKRKAEMLVSIGNGLAKVNAQKSAHLPSGWNTLYYLAQLGQQSIDRLIAEGRIHHRLRLHQARKLLAEFRPELAPKNPMPMPFMRQLARFSKFVETQAPNWSRIERGFFRDELNWLLKAVPRKSKTLNL